MIKAGTTNPHAAADRTARRHARCSRRHPWAGPQGRAGTVLLRDRRATAGDHCGGGRERQRQDHLGAAAAGPGRTDRGRSAVQGPRPAPSCRPPIGANSATTVQAIFQDPYEVYNPFYRVDHVLTTPVRKFGLAHTTAAAARADRAGAASGRAAVPTRSSAAIRINCPAGSANASWSPARCCCARG